jgi:hypothetical protein
VAWQSDRRCASAEDGWYDVLSARATLVPMQNRNKIIEKTPGILRPVKVMTELWWAEIRIVLLKNSMFLKVGDLSSQPRRLESTSLQLEQLSANAAAEESGPAGESGGGLGLVTSSRAGLLEVSIGSFQCLTETAKWDNFKRNSGLVNVHVVLIQLLTTAVWNPDRHLNSPGHLS